MCLLKSDGTTSNKFVTYKRKVSQKDKISLNISKSPSVRESTKALGNVRIHKR